MYVFKHTVDINTGIYIQMPMCFINNWSVRERAAIVALSAAPARALCLENFILKEQQYGHEKFATVTYDPGIFVHTKYSTGHIHGRTNGLKFLNNSDGYRVALG